MAETLDTRAARRLALAKSGLLVPQWTGLPRTAGRSKVRQRAAAHAVIRRFGYLQLDTVSVAGARSHVLVLLSRLAGFSPDLGERLLVPGEPLFEYWGHQACWLPLELYPVFGFRRRGIARSEWWGRAMKGNRGLARDIKKRIRDEGPIRSADLDGTGSGGWWGHKPAKRVVVALWSSGELAVRERSGFQRTFDLPERVIPEVQRTTRVSRYEAFRTLMSLALDGHGWAATGTLATTWALRNVRPDIHRALEELQEAGEVTACSLHGDGRETPGWIRVRDLELAERLRGVRPGSRRGVLLSPFDPVLWDRQRVARLFGFDQVLEIFKPASARRYGYFCLPVLAGERLVARVDLKADRAGGRLRVVSRRFEPSGTGSPGSGPAEAAYRSALERYARALKLSVAE